MTHVHTDLVEIPELGLVASVCAAYGAHRPRPLRYVWHHVLPQTCGGKTEPANLVSLCDTCHYSVHALMSLLARYNGDTPAIKGWSRLGSEGQRELAWKGYQLAVKAKTEHRIPNEGIPRNS